MTHKSQQSQRFRVRRWQKNFRTRLFLGRLDHPGLPQIPRETFDPGRKSMRESEFSLATPSPPSVLLSSP